MPIYQLIRMAGAGEEAEAIVEEAFARAINGGDTAAPANAMKISLYRTALNLIETFAGSARREVDAPLAAGSASDRDLDDAASRRIMIDRALAELQPADRVLIILRDIQGLHCDDIAAIVGLPQTMVETRIFDARRQLRPRLEPLISRGAWIVR